ARILVGRKSGSQGRRVAHPDTLEAFVRAHVPKYVSNADVYRIERATRRLLKLYSAKVVADFIKARRAQIAQTAPDYFKVRGADTSPFPGIPLAALPDVDAIAQVLRDSSRGAI